MYLKNSLAVLFINEDFKSKAVLQKADRLWSSVYSHLIKKKRKWYIWPNDCFSCLHRLRWKNSAYKTKQIIGLSNTNDLWIENHKLLWIKCVSFAFICCNFFVCNCIELIIHVQFALCIYRFLYRFLFAPIFLFISIKISWF